jgi:hypothetical protein
MGVACHHDTPHGMAKATAMGFPVRSVHGENKLGDKNQTYDPRAMRGIRRLCVLLPTIRNSTRVEDLPEGNGELVRESPLPCESATEDEDEYDRRWSA